jgi:hypothetical protein
LSSARSHELQAQHNEALATTLVAADDFRDWACTASFYAAVHYFEAFLAANPTACRHPEATALVIDHSESTIPQDITGRRKYSPHVWREELIRHNRSRQTWRSYRQLRESSQIARYHTDLALKPRLMPARGTAHDFFDKATVTQLTHQELGGFKADLGY